MRIEIRPVAGLAEYKACEALQQETWGPFGVVPDHLLLTMQKSGGAVIGAFDSAAPGAPMVGFVFSFLGRDDAGPKHASHMAAVSPRYRDAGIGERLKWAQRDYVLAQGIARITWTYDPLLSRNARLNIAKLGAVCRTYLPNHYGPEPEDPNGELPSDRFQVDWWLAAERVVARREARATLPTAAELRALAPLANPDPHLPAALPPGDQVLIQIPADKAALEEAAIATARVWLHQVRALAHAAFAAGLTVVEYARDGDVGLYLLAQWQP